MKDAIAAKQKKVRRNWSQSIGTGGLVIFVVLMTVSCNSQEESSRPNILFAISDDQSFPHTGAYGCNWVQTPAFDRIAEEGLLFMNCYTPNAKCAPSRSCIITGRYSWQLEEAGNHVCYFRAVLSPGKNPGLY